MQFYKQENVKDFRNETKQLIGKRHKIKQNNTNESKKDIRKNTEVLIEKTIEENKSLKSSIFTDDPKTPKKRIESENNNLKTETLKEDSLDVKVERKRFHIISPKAQIVKKSS
ncbi:hypothetical protein FQA39_LY07631 [Lamprigera yunnana]|nr:hypothetical protein FQA39_LY07631 [Lamprigera yunnana]